MAAVVPRRRLPHQAAVPGSSRSGPPGVVQCVPNQSGGRGPATAAVELRGVYRRFGRTMVLAGLDLTVDEGELYGLIGPNGAGKTTALRVALGLLQAEAGEVRLLGRDP